MSSQKKPILCLMGPTAVGKTELALKLAEHLPLEIVNVDSTLVYKGLDIGTGKPSITERARVPHHLLDIRDPSQIYSAADFRVDALKLLDEISARGKIPLLVGGTGLYFQVLQFGLSPLPSANPAIRARLFEEGERLGWAHMHDKLKQIDEMASLRIHPNDPQRIQRALEVYEVTGKRMTEFFDCPFLKLEPESPQILSTQNADYWVQNFVLMPHCRAELHEKIEKRFHKMLASGFLEEVQRLYARDDLHLGLPAMRAVGYRQIWGYLAKDYNFSEMQRLSITATRQLAKRQMTWLKRLQNICILENNHSDPLKTMINCVT